MDLQILLPTQAAVVVVDIFFLEKVQEQEEQVVEVMEQTWQTLLVPVEYMD
jgi:CHASE2 domain-containing sensor protein